ncbi:MAG: helix-turn-helix domain-containing protein [Bacillota bacterium]|nr:helix-turn-helix domain-containing protein [Bacillota bacterium]
MSECLTYTVGEAAKAIGVGRSLAYELVRRGDLRTVHVGRRILVPRDAVRDFLGLGQEQAPASPGAARENGSDEVTYLVTIRRVRAGGAMNTPSVLPASW